MSDNTDRVNLPAGIEARGGFVWTGGSERPDLGSCCACGRADNVDAIVQINRHAPDGHSGNWGCVVCGIDGGVSVTLCKHCRTIGTPVFLVAVGYCKDNQRISIDKLVNDPPFEHNLAKHPELAQPSIEGSRHE